MIKIKNLTKRLGKTYSLSDLNLNIERGIYGLVGHNGAGKSTLFRLISNVYLQDEGTISIDGYNNDTKDAKATLFFLPDDPYYPNYANIKQISKFYECFYDVDKVYFDNLIKQLNLPLNKSISTFSKGMKRQAFLALALSINVKYLLLDEAFDGIDPMALDLIKQEIIKRYADSDKSVIIASHNIESLEKLCDKFVIISNGRMVVEGDETSFSHVFNKYQIVFNLADMNLIDVKNVRYSSIDESLFTDLGLEVISFNKVGSIYEIVIKVQDKEDPKKMIIDKLDPLLIDEIPLSYAEIITLEMLRAKKEDERK